VGAGRIIAVLQFGSNTMKQGEHVAQIAPALVDADNIIFLEPDNFSLESICNELGASALSFNSVDAIVKQLADSVKPQDHILIMSNKGFGGIHEKLLTRLSGMVSITN
jgi:UDP-N-acetylmuramate: L-alanyl-gamma-D-glutamyl-meso-diaminopimelate ligase